MIGIIITIYAIAFFAYWGVQFGKAVPRIIQWTLFIVALPILVPIGMVRSLPEYLKKEGKWYKYRWLVYFALFMIVVNIILFCLPE